MNRTAQLILFTLLTATSAAWAAPPEVPQSAYAEGAIDAGDARVETRLLVDASQVAPGATVRVGVLFTMDEHWHVYWRNSGSSGLPTRLDFSGSELIVDDLIWPAPEAFSEANGLITTYGYGHEVLLSTRAVVPQDVGESVTINANVDYLACAEQCIQGVGSLSLELPVGDAWQPAEAGVVSLFDEYARQAPIGADAAGLDIRTALSTSAVRPNDEFRLAIAAITCPGPPADGAACRDLRFDDEALYGAFIPEAGTGLDLVPVEQRDHPTAFEGAILEISGFAGPDDPGEDQVLAGILNLVDHEGQRLSVSVSAPLARASAGAEVLPVTSPLLGDGVTAPPGVPRGDAASPDSAATLEPSEGAAPPAPEPQRTLWGFLLLAFIGGIILNVMPCVFPVLALKVHALFDLGQKQVYNEDAPDGGRLVPLLAYTAGVLIPLWTLGLGIVALRNSGASIGWGAQFQYPILVAVAAGIVTMFAANLFGVFEVWLGAGRLGKLADQSHGARKAFLEGILLVILATPCAAPGLGPSIGFGLLSGSVVNTVLIFTAVGLGLVFPFALLVLIPQWVKLLPKPGPWMNHFKHFVGFTFIGAVVWLGSIVGDTTGTAGMTGFYSFVVGVALICWIFGRMQDSGVRLFWGVLTAVVLLGATGYLTLQFEYDRDQGSDMVDDESHGPIAWQSFDEVAISAELDSGRPVFVDFTAEWCATCKANEHMVIESDEVVEAINAHNVAMFVADWTLPDERIEQALARHGRASVPMYLVFSPSAPDAPALLPELLSVDTVVEAIRSAAGAI